MLRNKDNKKLHHKQIKSQNKWIYK